MKPKILFIGTLSSIPSGQALVSEIVYEELKKKAEVYVVNLGKDSHNTGVDSPKRIFQILSILLKCLYLSFRVDKFYLTISESVSGNFRDVIIYMILFRKLKDSYIHVHGGRFKLMVLSKSTILQKINTFFISKLKGVIILGDTHRAIFEGIVPPERLKVIHNFYEARFEGNIVDINHKYTQISQGEPINILYLSNFYEGKGYEYLLKAITQLEAKYMSQIQVLFAGGFDNEVNERNFRDTISNYSNIQYLGIVKGDAKAELLSKSHVLCFPSYIEEGQGISVIEGYVNGCYVITTGISGIADIFEHNVNGLAFAPKSSESIKDAIIQLVNNKNRLSETGQQNFEMAKQKFPIHIFREKIRNTIE
jgi:glycosyltransferase involved in cell wall biosynthesis